MFLHLTKHTAVQVAKDPLPAGCIKSMCTLGSNDEAQTLPDCLSLKKNSIRPTIKDTASQMTKTKMTETKDNYTILSNLQRILELASFSKVDN
jgi:hypothetical protein